MYYTTKIAPECANVARELSQFMACPNNEHWRSMERFIGYLKRKKKHSLIYRKPKEIRPIGHVDVNYATNADDRKSISGSIHTVGRTITHWQSKKQSIVTLS